MTATPAPHDRAALVIVDVQNDYCSTDGALGRRGVVLPTVDAGVDAIERLSDAARRLGISVVYVRTTHDARTNAGSWLRRSSGGGGVCAPGTWGAQFYRLTPADTDIIVTKHRYSAFVGTDLDLILRAQGVDHLYFAGFLTNVCVETSLRDAFVRDYHVTLVADAAGSTQNRLHQNTLETVAAYFGAVRTADEAVAIWSSSAVAV